MYSIGLFGEVNEEMSCALYTGLLQAAAEKEPVAILLHSYGGDVYAALAMFDMIRAFPGHTTTIAVGPCMSAGALLLQAGKCRAASPNAHIMVHYGSEVSESHASAQQNKRLTQRLKDIMHERSKVSKQTVNGWFKVDRYFSADEALKAGIIDAIEQPRLQADKFFASVSLDTEAEDDDSSEC